MGLQSVELVMAVEEEFSVEFSDGDAAASLETVAGMHAMLTEKLSDRGEPLDAEVVFDKLHSIIVKQLGVRPETVVPSASFVGDLGC